MEQEKSIRSLPSLEFASSDLEFSLDLKPKPPSQQESDPTNVHIANCSTLRCLFNVINVTMGLSVLSVPYIMRCTGWVFGFIIFISYTLISSYTAKLVGRIIYDFPKLESYPDIAQYAFGKPGKVIISIILTLELFAVTIAFLILIGDNMRNLFGVLDKRIYMLIGFAVVLPTVWLKTVKHLSYLSFIGVTSILFLIFVVLFQGFYRSSSPGSIIHPEPTSAFPENFMSMPIAFGVVMSALVAHSIFPSIHHGMRHPEKFSFVINIAYSVVLLTYLLVSTVGYLMFGEKIASQITKSLSEINQSNQALSILAKVAIALIIINPMCKYALEMNPVCLLLEVWIFRKRVEQGTLSKRTYEICRILLRTVMVMLSLLCAVFIPSFLLVLGFMGAFLCFSDSIIFPALCFLKLYGKKITLIERLWNYFLVAFGVGTLIVGTIWVALPPSMTNTVE